MSTSGIVFIIGVYDLHVFVRENVSSTQYSFKGRETWTWSTSETKNKSHLKPTKFHDACFINNSLASNSVVLATEYKRLCQQVECLTRIK